MLFDPNCGRAAVKRALEAPGSKRLRRKVRLAPVMQADALGRQVEVSTMPDHQPDDRPRQPSFGGQWVTVAQVTATARRSDKPRGWAGVVAGFDEGSPKSATVRSQAIRPPAGRDFTGRKGDSSQAGRLRGNVAANASRNIEKGVPTGARKGA